MRHEAADAMPGGVDFGRRGLSVDGSVHVEKTAVDDGVDERNGDLVV